jgi:hypothetical protein
MNGSFKNGWKKAIFTSKELLRQNGRGKSRDQKRSIILSRRPKPAPSDDDLKMHPSKGAFFLASGKHQGMKNKKEGEQGERTITAVDRIAGV